MPTDHEGYGVPSGWRDCTVEEDLTQPWYGFPSDEDEVGRQDYQHFVVRNLIHGNFSSPVEDMLTEGIQVLDVGTGSGRWLLEMATDYPDSSYIGIDIRTIFPTNDVPPNVTFTVANILKDLPFNDDTFGFVYQRNMMLHFHPPEWTAAMVEAARVTKPGGWVECFELDLDLENPPPDYTRLRSAVATLTEMKGLDISLVKTMANLLTSVGLTDVEADYVSCPFGWGGRVGQLCMKVLELGYGSLRSNLAPIMGISDTEYDKLVDGLEPQFRVRRSWTKVHYAFGMKPFK